MFLIGGGNGGKCVSEIWNFFLIGDTFFKLGAMGANVLVEFKNVFLIGGIFFTIGGIFFTIGGIFLKLGAKNYFEIEKISYFGNYMDPWVKEV